jgi:hypothetical protein
VRARAILGAFWVAPSVIDWTAFEDHGTNGRSKLASVIRLAPSIDAITHFGEYEG